MGLVAVPVIQKEQYEELHLPKLNNMSSVIPRHPIYHTLHPGQFLMGAKLFIGTPKVQKKVVLKINWYGLCENAWFPGQPVI